MRFLLYSKVPPSKGVNPTLVSAVKRALRAFLWRG